MVSFIALSLPCLALSLNKGLVKRTDSTLTTPVYGSGADCRPKGSRHGWPKIIQWAEMSSSQASGLSPGALLWLDNFSDSLNLFFPWEAPVLNTPDPPYLPHEHFFVPSPHTRPRFPVPAYTQPPRGGVCAITLSRPLGWGRCWEGS